MTTTPKCPFCGSSDKMVNHDGKWMCHGTHPAEEPNETPTPRTDAWEFDEYCDGWRGGAKVVLSDDCRQLERELAEARATILEHLAYQTSEAESRVFIVKQRDELKAKLEKETSRADKAEAACAEMRAALEKIASLQDGAGNRLFEGGCQGIAALVLAKHPRGQGWVSKEDHEKVVAANAEMRDALKKSTELLSLVLSEDINDPESELGSARDAFEGLLNKETPGQGWHSPEEWEKAQKHINNQRERIRYLEGATNHAEGTPLTRACLRIAELEQQLATLRKLFPEILSALESGGCTEDVSLEFLQHIPEEVRLVIRKYKQQLAEARKDGERLNAAIIKTLEENRSLADGDNCTLKTLKDAIDNAKGDR